MFLAGAALTAIFSWTVIGQAAAIDGPAPIRVDGAFDDWTGVAATATDPAGDARGPFDVTRVYATSRGGELFVRFDTGRVLNLQAGSPDDVGLVIRVGVPGGAYVEVRPRDRSYVLRGAGDARERHLGWADLGYVAAPTYASDEFEVRFDLGRLGAAPGETIAIELDGSDRLAEPIRLRLETPAARETSRAHTRVDPGDVRLVSLNTKRGGLLDGDRREALGRLLAAGRPDIIAIQEEYGGSADDLRAALARFVDVPAPPGARWNVHKHNDCVVASRLPVAPVASHDRSYAAAVVDLGASRALLVLSIHPKCCGYIGDADDDRRVEQTRAMIRTIDEVRRAHPGVGVVVLGDWNLVGSRRPLDLLIDPEGPALAHRPLPHLTRESIVTWRDEASDFPPGMLDLVTWSPGRLTARSGFVLDTRELDRGTLAALRVRADDSAATDHLLLVADYAFETGAP